MNKLQYETSPYLQQHASNPVDWYAWKPEAFAKAEKEDKPILVSIGYSTCHWCHVMEKESFEDREVAGFMNDHFVCIKVDREERPDVDQIYMEACQVLTGSGGWPLNVFLTPDKRPFYAGTYYPSMPAYNRPSWLQVLMNMSHFFQNKKDTVEDQANRLTEIIQNAGNTFTGNNLRVVSQENPLNRDLIDQIYQHLQRSFDSRNGGFGGAPKFPGTMSMDFLLAYYHYTGDAKALDHVLLSLDKMSMGGIYDHLGGGFARYATDAKWLVPHFEKMLYDNALLVSLLADAWKITGKPLYQETMEETLEWVAREMTHPDGGFYSAQDADSEGVEGKFYVWDLQEIEEVLGEDAPLFCAFYGVTKEGNWEEKNILWREKYAADFAGDWNLDETTLKERLAGMREKLFSVRDRRVHPGLDDKILLDWNALMCTAYAKAYRALGKEPYREAAVRNMHFLLDRFRQPEGTGLLHAYKDGRSQYPAFLDDYAHLIEALVNLYEITFDASWLLRASEFSDLVIEQFLDPKDTLFFFTSSEQKDILLRRKDLYDSATPSGNATMVRNLQRLGLLMGKDNYRNLASGMLHTMKDSVAKYPGSFSRWAQAIFSEVFGMPEVAVVGKDAFLVAREIQTGFLPQMALMASVEEDQSYPLLEGKSVGADTLIYVCRNYSCQRPVSTIAEFRQLVKAN